GHAGGCRTEPRGAASDAGRNAGAGAGEAGDRGDAEVAGGRSLRVVTHRLDVVTVRVEHEGAVVVRVVLRPQTRRTVVLAACCNGRLVEGVYRGARRDAKRDMDRRADRSALADPEVGPVRMAEAGAFLPDAVRGGQLHQARMAGGCECLQIESLALGVVAHDEAQVIDHWNSLRYLRWRRTQTSIPSRPSTIGPS